MTFFGAMFLASLVYSTWDMEKFLSRLTMMKLTLVLLSVTGIYLIIVFIRAEISYKKSEAISESKNNQTKAILKSVKRKRIELSGEK